MKVVKTVRHCVGSYIPVILDTVYIFFYMMTKCEMNKWYPTVNFPPHGYVYVNAAKTSPHLPPLQVNCWWIWSHNFFKYFQLQAKVFAFSCIESHSSGESKASSRKCYIEVFFFPFSLFMDVSTSRNNEFREIQGDFELTVGWIFSWHVQEEQNNLKP